MIVSLSFIIFFFDPQVSSIWYIFIKWVDGCARLNVMKLALLTLFEKNDAE